MIRWLPLIPLILLVALAGCSPAKGRGRGEPPDARLLAILQRDSAAVNDWLARGNPNVADSNGVTAAMLAAMIGDDDTLRALAARGADLRAVDRQGRNALIWAARVGGTPEVVQILVQGGVDPAVRDRQRSSALDWAARSGNTAVLKSLLALPNAARLFDRIPWDDALRPKDSDYGYTTPDGQYRVSSIGEHEPTPDDTAQAMVLAGADLKTALLAAGERGASPATVKLMLAHGAPVNIADPQGQTPLMLAASQGRADMIELLLAKGASPKARDQKGNSALYHATKAPDDTLEKRRKRDRIIALLRKAGLVEP